MAVIALARLPSLAGGCATPFWDGIPHAGRFAADPLFNLTGQHDDTLGMGSLVSSMRVVILAGVLPLLVIFLPSCPDCPVHPARFSRVSSA